MSTTPKILDTVILFADLVNSVAISDQIDYLEYDRLLNEYQQCLATAVKTDYSLGDPGVEIRIVGDQLSIFLYNPEDPDFTEDVSSSDSEQIIKKRNDRLFKIFRLSVKLKLAWLTSETNIKRITSQRKPHGIGIGIHIGPCVYSARWYERSRIEGYAINFAKRVESYSRNGKYSKIMASRRIHEAISLMLRGHSLLSQRIFWYQHYPKADELKGLPDQLRIYELKFFHRIAGLDLEPEQVKLYEITFENDPTDLWSYYMLCDYYGYDKKDWETVFRLANKAIICNEPDEKLYHDIGKASVNLGDFKLAETYFTKALELNPRLDISLEGLIQTSLALGQPTTNRIELARKILANNPKSPTALYQMYFFLKENNQLAEAQQYLDEAIKLWPPYKDLI